VSGDGRLGGLHPHPAGELRDGFMPLVSSALFWDVLQMGGTKQTMCLLWTLVFTGFSATSSSATVLRN
jgi:hypothetical protein